VDKYLINTPVGQLGLKGDDNHLYEIIFDPVNLSGTGNHLLKLCAEQIEAYFHGRLYKFDIPVMLKVSAFQLKVLNLVREIPFGETKSYGQLADLLGNRKTVRAIGNANGKNPIPIIIPCHRVIGTNGSLVGYSGGIWRKKWLIQHESSHQQLSLFPSFFS
jgi:methylated-DNA-[protein]-cysteine S-methyltransferase